MAKSLIPTSGMKARSWFKLQESHIGRGIVRHVTMLLFRKMMVENDLGTSVLG